MTALTERQLSLLAKAERYSIPVSMWLDGLTVRLRDLHEIPFETKCEDEAREAAEAVLRALDFAAAMRREKNNASAA